MNSNSSIKFPVLKLNNGKNMPQIGLGTWELSKKDAESSVFFALKVGYRLIDTASAYGNEDAVGKGINKAILELGIKREDIFVVTKLWNADHTNPRKALNLSLGKLGLDYVDLYLIHWPVKEAIITWKEFENFKKEGKARAIGVSNFTENHIEQFSKVSKEIPSVNQIEFSPFLYQKELAHYCKSKGIIVMSYSPLTRGKLIKNDLIKQIALAHNKTSAQVILRWHIQNGLIPIPKSKTPSRIKENLELFDFELTNKEMDLLSSLDKGARFCWNPNDAKWKFLGEASKLVKLKK